MPQITVSNHSTMRDMPDIPAYDLLPKEFADSSGKEDGKPIGKFQATLAPLLLRAYC